MKAACRDQQDVVRLLLDKGVHIEECNNEGWTALHFAAREGCIHTARLLLERGANVNALNSLHRTPLHLAAQCENHNTAVIRLLVDRDAALEARDNDGRSPLLLAIYYGGTYHTINLLLSLGGNPRARADDGTILRDVGGHPEVGDAERNTQSQRNARIRELLRQAGCPVETGKVPKHSCGSTRTKTIGGLRQV
ncbi:ankyrin [Schizophyllum commune H4-8]|uniref:ankyrin n=1 Tax=Schizophyllum commune (strain H4-8 / FGSC 9210) TaxID=578458 RepID=UPI00215EDAE4|nr:ankyrin [Schizophyllum commune H4-8]KAI5889900.1 ankyrin [Schizophyllum commune H4-8]